MSQGSANPGGMAIDSPEVAILTHTTMGLLRRAPMPRVLKCRQMPLEGLEHVLSIVLCDTERQIPRNYAAFCDPDDIDLRPKTAISK